MLKIFREIKFNKSFRENEFHEKSQVVDSFSEIRTSGIKLVTDRVPKIGILGGFGSGIEKGVVEGKLNKTLLCT